MALLKRLLVAQYPVLRPRAPVPACCRHAEATAYELVYTASDAASAIHRPADRVLSNRQFSLHVCPFQDARQTSVRSDVILWSLGKADIGATFAEQPLSAMRDRLWT